MHGYPHDSGYYCARLKPDGQHPASYSGPPLTVADLECDGWNLVFCATAGNGHEALAAFYTG